MLIELKCSSHVKRAHLLASTGVGSAWSSSDAEFRSLRQWCGKFVAKVTSSSASVSVAVFPELRHCYTYLLFNVPLLWIGFMPNKMSSRLLCFSVAYMGEPRFGNAFAAIPDSG
ncbi:hypothetical protein VNO77_16046 [Canavalia gladiata]|uniref:Uncharacterized protein n=1 Tax=Canavalia gladiata TaxID=3824 RepID=A0AAN9M558_CANGL